MYCYPGVLVECDPSIKSIIVKIDSEKNDFIVEELDDQTLVIKEGMLHILKMRLTEVTSPPFPAPTATPFRTTLFRGWSIIRYSRNWLV